MQNPRWLWLAGGFILYTLHHATHSGNFLATYNINSIYQH